MFYGYYVLTKPRTSFVSDLDSIFRAASVSSVPSEFFHSDSADEYIVQPVSRRRLSRSRNSSEATSRENILATDNYVNTVPLQHTENHQSHVVHQEVYISRDRSIVSAHPVTYSTTSEWNNGMPIIRHGNISHNVTNIFF